MENARHLRRRSRDSRAVGNIALDDLQAGTFCVLVEVRAPTHCEIVKHPNRPALREQAIYEVTSDKASTAGYKINSQCRPHNS